MFGNAFCIFQKVKRDSERKKEKKKADAGRKSGLKENQRHSGTESVEYLTLFFYLLVGKEQKYLINIKEKGE